MLVLASALFLLTGCIGELSLGGGTKNFEAAVSLNFAY